MRSRSSQSEICPCPRRYDFTDSRDLEARITNHICWTFGAAVLDCTHQDLMKQRSLNRRFKLWEDADVRLYR